MNRFALGRTGTRTVVGQADSDLSQRSRLLQALTDGDFPDKAASDAFDFLTSLGAPKGISCFPAQACDRNRCRAERRNIWFLNPVDTLAMQTLPLCGAATAATLVQRMFVQSTALTWASLQQSNLQLSTDSHA